MILCIGTTPAAQRVMVFKRVERDAVNRAVLTLDGWAGKSVNVAKVLRALGAEVTALGFAGGERGRALVKDLSGRGIETVFVEVAKPTRQCVTVIDESTGEHTELVEESGAAEPAAFETLLAEVERRLPGCEALVMSGTVAPGGMPDLYRRCVELAKGHGVMTLVDAQGVALREALAAGADLVKPNRVELGATVGRELADEGAVLEAAREIAAGGAGATKVVVTSGKGLVLAAAGDRAWRVRPPVVEVKNPIGSGDSFAAGLVWRLVRGGDLGEACRWAVAAGAANAMSWLPGELERAEVERLVAGVEVECDFLRAGGGETGTIRPVAGTRNW